MTTDIARQLESLELAQRRGSRIAIAGVALLGLAGAIAAVYTASLAETISERQQRITALDLDIEGRARPGRRVGYCR
jgi:hypothetical protein